ncbi:hypothetical protein AN403_1 [Pseudomonas fluorescens]|uniref:Uncharacterized protein n=1 Tax=Pseudomonas fluorescens TaxID=294 RepID=A0A0P9AMI0_PSEFL|nr:hypothetical protein AN403_1 [Pseudomonas fluorescens]
MDLQHQVGGAAVAIRISEGVAEGFGATAAAVQRLEIRIAGVQRVGVSAVGIQHQSAVSAGEGAGGDGAGVFPDRYPVRALHIVAQHIAVEGQQGFRGRAIAVVNRFGLVVGYVDIQRTGDGVAIAVVGHHGEVFAETIGTPAACMGFGTVEGVAVTDHAGRRVVTGDGQGAAQQGGDRLRQTCRHAAADHVDAADAEAGQPVGRIDGKGGALGQRAWVARRSVGQVGFIDGQLAILRRQTVEADRIVRNLWRHHRGSDFYSVVVRISVQAFFGKFGNAIETGSGEANGWVDSPAHFFEHDETMTTALDAARYTGSRGRSGSGGFSGLGRVVARRNGFLQLFDIRQLRFARRRRFMRVHMGNLIGEQLRCHLHTAAAPEGQLLAILQVHRHRALSAGAQLVAGEQPVPLDQSTPSAVARDREHLTDDLTDDTDERSHVHFLRCQPLSAPCLCEERAHGSSGLPGGSCSGCRFTRVSRGPGNDLAQPVAHGAVYDFGKYPLQSMASDPCTQQRCL